MSRKNKILLTLSILLLAVVVALLWTVQSFSLNASVCSAPIPAETTDPPEGQVALSAVQMYPTYRIPITFTSVEVRDTVTKEPLEPGLVLYDEEPVHLLRRPLGWERGRILRRNFPKARTCPPRAGS